MEEYRAYVIGPDDHIINRVDIRCFDDKEARRLAKIAVDGHAVVSIKGASVARA